MAYRSVLTACFVCSAFGAALAATSGPVTLDFTPFGVAHVASASARLAPIDTSFGHYPLSVTGIHNAIRRYDGTTRLDDGPIAYAIVAIRDWETRFPRDPWIPRELLYIQRVYEHAHTDEGLGYAQRVAAWLETDYPATEYAGLSRTELAKFEPPGEPPKAATVPDSHATLAARATDPWSRFSPRAAPTGPPNEDGSR